MEVKAKTIITGVYIALVLGFSISLAFPTINYLHFYKAIETLDISVLNFRWQLKNNCIIVIGDLVISNPEDYSGLLIRVIHYNFWFASFSNYMTKYYVTGSSFWFPGEKGAQIGAKMNVTVPFNITSTELTSEMLGTLQMLHEEGELTWIVDGSAWLWTFLSEPLQVFFPPKIIEQTR